MGPISKGREGKEEEGKREGRGGTTPKYFGLEPPLTYAQSLETKDTEVIKRTTKTRRSAGEARLPNTFLCN